MTKNRLQERRKELGLTQKQVAAATGIAEFSYQRYEHGSRAPDVITAAKLAKTLKTTIDDLFLVKDK